MAVKGNYIYLVIVNNLKFEINDNDNLLFYLTST